MHCDSPALISGEALISFALSSSFTAVDAVDCTGWCGVCEDMSAVCTAEDTRCGVSVHIPVETSTGSSVCVPVETSLGGVASSVESDIM